MDPGRLNRRITLQREQYETDSEGHPAPIFEDVACVWAKIETLRGHEFFKAQAINTNITYKITIRYRKDIEENMRVLYEGKSFNIVYPDDVNEAHRYIALLCEVVK